MLLDVVGKGSEILWSWLPGKSFRMGIKDQWSTSGQKPEGLTMSLVAEVPPLFCILSSEENYNIFTNNHQPKSQPLPFRLSFSSRLPKMSLPYSMWYNQLHHQLHQIVLQCVCSFFLRFVVHQIVQSVLLLFFYVCSENDKSTLKPKTSGFVLFSSSELGSGSGRSQASLQNLDRITKHVILAHRRFIYLILAIFIVLQMVPHFVPLLITKFRPYTTKINTY